MTVGASHTQASMTSINRLHYLTTTQKRTVYLREGNDLHEPRRDVYTSAVHMSKSESLRYSVIPEPRMKNFRQVLLGQTNVDLELLDVTWVFCVGCGRVSTAGQRPYHIL